MSLEQDVSGPPLSGPPLPSPPLPAPNAAAQSGGMTRAQTWLFAKRSGAITLAICILIPSIAGLFIVGYRYGQSLINEVDFVRALQACKEDTLSSYDRKLYYEFGLWGVNLDKCSHPSSDKILLSEKQSFTENKANFVLSQDKSIFAEESLKAYIYAHMKLRMPLLLSQDLIQAIRGQQEALPPFGDQLGSDLASLSPQAEDQLKEAEALAQQGGNQLPSPDPGAPNNPGSPPTPGSPTNPQQPTGPGQGDGASQKALLYVSKASDEIITNLIPVYEAHDLQAIDGEPGTDPNGEGGNSGTDPNGGTGKAAGKGQGGYSPEQLAKLAKKWDDFSKQPSDFVGDKLYLTEYILNYFPAVVTQKDGSDLKTPYGKPLKSLGRNGQAEVIVTGIRNRYQAEKTVKYLIIGMRVAVHLSCKLNDARQMTKYRTLANVLSALIAILTLGHVVLEPEAITYILVTLAAVRAAFKDYGKLIKGKGIPALPSADGPIPGMESLPDPGQNSPPGLPDPNVTPGEGGGGSITLYYRDFLRIFLLPQSDQKLCHKISQELTSIFQDDLSCAFTLQGSFKGKTLTIQGEYPLHESLDEEGGSHEE